jgi:hypothetical protein
LFGGSRWTGVGVGHLDGISPKRDRKAVTCMRGRRDHQAYAAGVCFGIVSGAILLDVLGPTWELGQEHIDQHLGRCIQVFAIHHMVSERPNEMLMSCLWLH